jgi:ferredoxin
MDSQLKKIRIVYDPAACIGNGECVKNDPSVFKFNDAAQKAILIGGTLIGKIVTVELDGDETKIKCAIQAAASCPVNAFVVTDLDTQKTVVGKTIETTHSNEIQAAYDDSRDFVLDPKGYFLIRILPEKKEIEVGFCNEKNKVVLKVVGKRPIDIYHTIATKADLGLRLEHYAYLGRELQKAFHCVQVGLVYIQDDELHHMQPQPRHPK